ncbi:unnamed protein product, partial [Iphiclides podalirius]
MVLTSFNDNISDTKYVFKRKAGRSIIERRPIFSPDGEHVLLIVENIVRVYNIQTGDCTRTLETETSIQELISVQFLENEDYNLYGCSDKGCVTIWTWEKGAVLREITLQIPNELKILTFDLLDSDECFITAVDPSSKHVFLATYSVKSGGLLYEYRQTKPLYFDIIRVALGWCNGDRFAAITNGTKVLFIQNLNQPHLRTEIMNHNKFRILSVAAHHKDNAVAITDTFGRVTPSLAPWPSQNLLLTVVVANAQLRVVSTLLECGGLSPVVSTLLECGGLSPVARAINAALVYHRPLDALLMGGRSGHLQLYSTASDKVLYNNNCGNFIRRTACCSVVSLAANFRGEFCVSAGRDQKIRIWRRENTVLQHRKRVTWSCMTACYYSSGSAHQLSHGILNDFKVGDRPAGDRVESMPYLKRASRDDVVTKIFNMHKGALVDGQALDRGMNSDEEMDMGGVAISQDGSLIAAWFGCKLTLWDTHLSSLRSALSHPSLRPKGLQVQFGTNDAAHYLVCTTEKCLAVWSLLSLTIKWYVQLNPTCLAADPSTNKMAVVTDNNDVYIFTPHSSTPLMVHKCVLDPRTGIFKQCTFVASSKDAIRLYVMRNDSEIFCLEPAQAEQGRLEAVSGRAPSTKFGALLAEQIVSEVRAARPTSLDPDLFYRGGDVLAQFLSAAPHMMPPMSLLCTPILEHISGQRQTEHVDDERDYDKHEIESQSSDGEDDVITKTDNSPAPQISELWTPNYEEVKEKRLKKILKEPFLDLQTTASMFA